MQLHPLLLRNKPPEDKYILPMDSSEYVNYLPPLLDIFSFYEGIERQTRGKYHVLALPMLLLKTPDASPTSS